MTKILVLASAADRHFVDTHSGLSQRLTWRSQLWRRWDVDVKGSVEYLIADDAPATGFAEVTDSDWMYEGQPIQAFMGPDMATEWKRTAPVRPAIAYLYGRRIRVAQAKQDDVWTVLAKAKPVLPELSPPTDNSNRAERAVVAAYNNNIRAIAARHGEKINAAQRKYNAAVAGHKPKIGNKHIVAREAEIAAAYAELPALCGEAVTRLRADHAAVEAHYKLKHRPLLPKPPAPLMFLPRQVRSARATEPPPGPSQAPA